MKIVHESTVDLVDHMGSDLTVVNSARVSFDKHVEELSDSDAKLISYLARHKHFTPFTHCFATFRINVPIFVRGQLARHTVGFTYNEVSRRYVDDEPMFYMPKEWRSKPEGSMKQGSGSDIIDIEEIDVMEYTDSGGTSRQDLLQRLYDSIEDCLTAYTRLLDVGVAPEQARMILPQNTMTSFYWTGSLAAWARMCSLRLDPHAQQETKEVAVKVTETMERLFPLSWVALMEHGN